MECPNCSKDLDVADSNAVLDHVSNEFVNIHIRCNKCGKCIAITYECPMIVNAWD